MATLNMRYGGNIISLPEGANFSPSNFGTARLKYRVNSSSVGELGLTTNTNAKEYCNLQMRVGGQICFIGRVSTTSYVSGDSVDYHGSSTGSRSQVVSTSSEYLTSIATKPIDYRSSSMSTSTSQYTQVTSTEQIETRSYTQEVWSRSETGTSNSGSGNGTSAAQPSIRTVTNATGSTVTSRTVVGDVLTNSSFKESYINREAWCNTWTVWRKDYNANPPTLMWTYYQTSKQGATIQTKSTIWNQHTTYSTKSGKDPSESQYLKTLNITITSTYYNKSSTLNSASTSNPTTSSTFSSSYRQTLQYVSSIKTSTRAAYKSTTQSVYAVYSSTLGGSAGSTTYGSYSQRYTYYWTSCKKITNNYYSTQTVHEYSTRSYTGTTYYTSITRSTTSVSETIHNMNI